MNDRSRQARSQLGLPASFRLVSAADAFEVQLGHKVFRVNLPEGLYLVQLEDPTGSDHVGLVHFEDVTSSEIWTAV